MKVLFFFLLLVTALLFSNGLFAFQDSDSDSTEINFALDLIEKAKKLGFQNKPDSSEKCFKKAKSIFLKYKSNENYVKTLFYQSLFYKRYYGYEKMLPKFDSLISLSKTLLTNNIFVAKIICVKGVALKSLDHFHEAIVAYEQADNYSLKIEDQTFKADLWFRLACAYRDISDLNKSMEYVNKGKRILNSVSSNPILFSNFLDVEAEIYYKRKLYKKVDSLSYLTLKIYEKHNNMFGILGCYEYLGRVSLRTQKYNQALYWYNKCLDYFYSKSSTIKYFKNMLEANYLLFIGDVYFELKDYQLAYNYYFSASKLIDNYSIIQLSLGHTFTKLNKFDSAIHYYHKGMLAKNNNFSESNIYHNPDISKALSKKPLIRLLKGKTRAFFLKHKFGKIKDIKDLKASFSTGNATLNLIDLWLNDFSSSGSKLDYSDFVKPAYEQSILTSLTLLNLTKDNVYKEQAFRALERNKAGVLFNDIKLNSEKKYSNISDSLTQKENNLKSSLSYYTSQLKKQESKKEKQDSAKVSQYQEKIFTLNREREALEALFEKQFPKYHQLKYAKDSVSVAELQNNILNPQTTLIEYFTGDSATYVFVINKNRFEAKKLPVIDSLEQKVKKLTYYLQEKDKQAFSDLSFQLYQQLFEPLNIKNPNLIIIPDGALWQLNFDLLLRKQPQKLDYRKFDYLIKDYTISYAYSAKLLKQDLRENIKPNQNEVLAFSYNNPDDISVGSYIAMRGFRDENLGDLPGTRKEIKAVSSVVDGAYYYGSFANEKNFKENAKDYSILHLALHGVIDNEEPMNSKLYFTQNKDTLEDNYLHAFELYNLELNAELAVLSACNTGSGKLIKGEGIMSLGRAFTYAGCKSLLLSQWEVSDAFTPALMKEFYKNLKDGKTKAAALREAKLTYLAAADNLSSNPFY